MWFNISVCVVHSMFPMEVMFCERQHFDFNWKEKTKKTKFKTKIKLNVRVECTRYNERWVTLNPGINDTNEQRERERESLHCSLMHRCYRNLPSEFSEMFLNEWTVQSVDFFIRAQSIALCVLMLSDPKVSHFVYLCLWVKHSEMYSSFKGIC